MKPLLTLLILFCTLQGCKSLIKKQKPFIIVDKMVNYYRSDGDTCTAIFEYEDKNGQTSTFRELASKYNIGDTIK